ncbi:MAG TPA: lysophospholipid acyltransferase family protein [Candidatus Thermoplasmatota archaeon]|nr:lysophospholipid acyltransferase family protein [Candidatus Thermoplasmatota archaeon]
MADTPTVRPTNWEDERHATRLYRVLQIIVSPIIRFLFRTRRRGHKTIPKRGPVILVSNHASNLDPVIVVGSIPRTIFHLGKHTLFTTPFRRWFFQKLGGQIPVDRMRGGNEDAIRAAVSVLNRGLALGIYPEGRRSPDGRVYKGKTGVARVALLSGAPVYPVALVGLAATWPKGKAFPRFFRRTECLVGSPRQYAVDAQKADDLRELRRVTDELMGDLANLLGQPYDPATAPMLRGEDEAATPANV